MGTEQEIVIRTNKIRIFNFTETIKTQKKQQRNYKTYQSLEMEIKLGPKIEPCGAPQ